jgi:hypothetical protein
MHDYGAHLSTAQALAVQSDRPVNGLMVGDDNTITTPSGAVIPVLINYTDRLTDIEYGHRMCHPGPGKPLEVSGYNEIYCRPDSTWDSRLGAMVPVLCTEPRWYVYHESDGGSIRSVALPTQQAAEQNLVQIILQEVAIWEAKVAWQRNGDKTVERRPAEPRSVIRCGGVHYTLGEEPNDHEWRTKRSYFGFGGHCFTFRMLATGEIITSRNVWHQGRIPAEYSALLPDNAEMVPVVV